MQLNGLHHVTAITGQAKANVDFYTTVLGLRMVKKTVNQDDVSAYHLYYGDTTGSPGTAVTFFDWPHIPPARRGPGSIGDIWLRVNGRDALERWATRLSEHGVEHNGIESIYGRDVIRFTDPEGQHLALVDDGGADFDGDVWATDTLPAEDAIRGMDSVTIYVREIEQLAHVLTEVMDYAVTATYPHVDDTKETVTQFSVGAGGPGRLLYVVEQPSKASAMQGIGGVHHVAFRVADAESQDKWRERLSRVGLRVSTAIDRFYFRSIYYRVPGNVLFEIATDDPGFATDETVDTLGETLALPPFLEPHRAEIEAGLQPI